MTLYQFDKAALERLRDDVLENPLKYEEILKKTSYAHDKDTAGKPER